MKVANTCTRYLVVDVARSFAHSRARLFSCSNTQHINTKVILRARCVKNGRRQKGNVPESTRGRHTTAILPICIRLKPHMCLSLERSHALNFCVSLSVFDIWHCRPGASTRAIVSTILLYHVEKEGQFSNVLRW